MGLLDRFFNSTLDRLTHLARYYNNPENALGYIGRQDWKPCANKSVDHGKNINTLKTIELPEILGHQLTIVITWP